MSKESVSMPTDTERLDWLNGECAAVTVGIDEDDGIKSFAVYRNEKDLLHGRMVRKVMIRDDLRSAIDAAMESEEK